MIGAQVDHAELRTMLRICTSADQPLMVHGEPGIGKTVAVEDFAMEVAKDRKLAFSMDLKDINREDVFFLNILPLHLFDIGELKGIMFPDEERIYAKFLSLGMLPTAGQGLMAYDEINLANMMVLNNAYQLTLGGRLGQYKLPKAYRQVAMGNLLTDGGNITPMPNALRDRFFHVELLRPKSDAWVKWAVKKGLNPLVIDYVAFYKQHLFTYKPDADTDDYAFATARGWEKISDAFKFTDMSNTRQVEMVVQAKTGLGGFFRAWLELVAKYSLNIEAIWKAKKIDVPAEVDKRYAMVEAVCGMYREHTTDKDALTLLKIAQCFPKEFTTTIIHQCKLYDDGILDRLEKVMSQDEYDALLNNLMKMHV
jgi:hypothetical protein